MEFKELESGFKPVQITLETQEEVNELFAVLNHTAISRVLQKRNKNWYHLWSFLHESKITEYGALHMELQISLNN